MTTRFRICLAVWIATLAASLLCSSSRAESFDVGNGKTIEITPAMKVAVNDAAAKPYESSDGILIQPGNFDAQVPEPEDTAAPTDDKPKVAAAVSKHAYQSVYDSIPFRRSEFNSNPTYRHDATMEILTGNPRHQTIIRHTPRAQTAGPRIPIIPFTYHLDYNSRFRSIYYLNYLYGGWGGYRGFPW